jgi:hypothetical protein
VTGLAGYVSPPIEPSRVDDGAARVIDGDVAVCGAVLPFRHGRHGSAADRVDANVLRVQFL